MRPLPRRLALAALSLASTLALVEFGARWYVEGGVVPALASLVGSDAGVALAAENSALVPDPDLGYALNPAKKGFNARGIRHGELEPGRRSEVRRVLVLGDSVSFDPGGWQDLLRERLEREHEGEVELINASIPGYTTHQERLLYEHRLADLEPDLVILQHCINDNHRFLHQIGPGGKRLFTPEARRAMVAGGPGWLDVLCRSSYFVVELRERLIHRRMERDAREPWDRLEGYRTAWEDASWEDFAREVEILRDEQTRHGGRLVVVSFPLESQIFTESLAEDPDWVRKPQRMLLETCARLGVPAIDLFDAFLAAAEEPGTLFRDGLHLTPEGHALAEAVVAAALDE